ncbi:sugar ABC transporter ATP-binding protein [Murimonas intestini]|uniref:sugar ABC transporter ATP-binding protein n=1 Tax=Murimonas intestini TaxID=1337051 RepID=UPI00248BCA54|nr:sugar ABC transporter ATP-binding protein [Murimonas intestini]
MGEVILQTKKLSKAFADKKVVSEVDFRVEEGEIVALLGENGAGKSTLKNMLVGLLKPTAGVIVFDGVQMQEVKMGETPIAAVHQELSLFLNLSVAENICIEDFPGSKTLVNWKRCREEALKYMKIMNIHIDPDAIAGTLGPGEQQLIEIAKAIRLKPRVLILDEPTASLTTPEREQLFRVMDTLRRQNIGMIFITHFLDEVFQVCGRVVVLRNGVKVCDENIGNITKHDVEKHMVGHALFEKKIELKEPQDEVALKIENFQSENFVDINLAVKKGEILGIAGLIGAGRTELLESIFGLRKTTGTIEILGKRLEKWSPGQMVKAGVAMVPEDRKNCGIFPRRDLKENITCASIEAFLTRRLKGFGFKDERRNAEAALAEYKVSCPGIDAYITELSGGNQQKVIVARWLSQSPAVCMFDDPTRGVDIGAKEEISNHIVEMAKKGTAVILVSSDPTELLSLSHRVLVMRRGRIVGEVSREEFDLQKILSASSSKQEDE